MRPPAAGKRIGRSVRPILLNLLVAAFAILTTIPLVWMVSVSLMPGGEANRFPPPFPPSRISFEHYRDLLAGRWIDGVHFDYRILPAFGNSLALASLSTAFSLCLTIPAGYAFAKLRFPGRTQAFRLLLAAAVIPAQVAMLPQFLMLQQIGLVNTYAGAMLPQLAGIYATLYTRQSVLGIPDEMLDAARVDGASEWQVFWRIVVPLLRPVIVTLGLFAFLSSWGDFLWPLIILTDQMSYTLPVALAAISREHAQDGELMMAGAVLTTLPVLLIYLALQRYYIAGLLGGGVKG